MAAGTVGNERSERSGGASSPVWKDCERGYRRFSSAIRPDGGAPLMLA